MNLLNKVIYYGGSCRATLLPPRLDSHYATKHLTKEEYTQFVSRLQPGDVVLTSPQPGLISSKFISGKYTHVGIYVGDAMDSQYKHGFIHSVNPAATVEETHSVLTAYTGFQVWRSDLTAACLKTVCKRAKNTVNKVTKYDYEFITDSTGELVTEADASLYCSELIEFAYRGKKRESIEFYKHKRLGKEFYIPETFIAKGRGFTKVFEGTLDDPTWLI